MHDPGNTKEEYLNDTKRINYISDHLDNLAASIRYESIKVVDKLFFIFFLDTSKILEYFYICYVIVGKEQM